MQSYEQALERIVNDVNMAKSSEMVPLSQAHGRVVAQTLYAESALPATNKSAMDGYALRFDDLDTREDWLPVSARIAAGDFAGALMPKSVARIFTGADLPVGADTVVMQEDVVRTDDSISLRQLPSRGENVRRRGEDIAEGEALVTRGRQIDATLLGLLTAQGIATIPCFCQLTVAFFSTGNELCEPGDSLQSGQIFNSNRFVLAAQIRDAGAVPIDLGVCGDSKEATLSLLKKGAALADCIISTGGVSVGEEDHVKSCIEHLGNLEAWKVAMKPGKPIAFGRVNGVRIFGLPGNPVSAFVTFHVLVRPWILQQSGRNDFLPRYLMAVSAGSAVNEGGRLDFRRAIMTQSDAGQWQVRLFARQGSGTLSSLAQCNVLLPMQAGAEICAGDAVEVIPIKSIESG